MADYGSKYTDKELQKMEKKITDIYSEAQKDIEEKIAEFTQKFYAKHDIYYQKLQNGEITQEQFDQWYKGQVFQSKQWEAKKDQIFEIIQSANKEATTIINGGTISVFAENANWSHYDLEKTGGVDFGFGIYDAHAVTNLIKNDPQILPKWKINEKKDYVWNKKKVNNSVAQGIIQGEGLDKIAERIAISLKANNMNTMLTFARTAMTGAQNAGRNQGLMDAKNLGINVTKVWMATLDDHTRLSHQAMDGEEQKVGDTWHPMKFSNGCRFPGDPQGPPHEVYNCRCTLVSDIKDYPSKYNRYDNIDGKPIKNMSYSEWLLAKIVGGDTTPHDFSDPLLKAQDELKSLQEEVINKGADKTFSGIWKDDVTYADWESKKGSIQAKKDYYNDQITKLADQLANDPNAPQWVSDKLDKFLGLSESLEEFEKHGEEYSELLEKLEEAKKAVQDLSSVPAGLGFASNAWDDKVKALAKQFDYDELDEADKYYRAYLDQIWDTLTDEEKYAVWEYTQNSNPMNKSLSGYHDRWGRAYFLGPANTDWGHEDSWRYIPREFERFGKNGHVDYKQAITDLTLALDKSTLQEGCILVRGSGTDGLAGLIEGNLFTYEEAERIINMGISEMRKAFVGQPFQNHSFMSTGIASGTGFGGGVSYEIYAPAGTHGMYVEPQSYFGHTISGAELYETGKRYRYVGDEAEVLLQRGMTFRITDISRSSGGGIHVKMEVIDQPDYFVHGDEDTYNNGQTRHRR